VGERWEWAGGHRAMMRRDETCCRAPGHDGDGILRRPRTSSKGSPLPHRGVRRQRVRGHDDPPPLPRAALGDPLRALKRQSPFRLNMETGWHSTRNLTVAEGPAGGSG
jgi:hypothetical protein